MHTIFIFILGLIMGAISGVMAIALCLAAKKADKDESLL